MLSIRHRLDRISTTCSCSSSHVVELAKDTETLTYLTGVSNEFESGASIVAAVLWPAGVGWPYIRPSRAITAVFCPSPGTDQDLTMKILLLCMSVAAALSCVQAGALLARGLLPYRSLQPYQSVAWPGAHTAQYVSTVPSYSFGYNPQLAYQFSPIAQIPAYYPASPAYYPASPVYYPASPAFYPPGTVVAQPGYPVPAAPAQPPQPPQQPEPAQPAGDADTAVVDAAPSPGQFQSDDATQQATQTQEQPPASTFPSFPNYPQLPQQPVSAAGQPIFPQFPQGTIPNLPQFPQLPGFPGFPQGPASPAPQYPQGPSSTPPPSFPAADGGDKGINDEDTISVESA
ncbi:hypothetical protein JYU34_003316 [Plutella xylostella]|uniref:Uncharacterized protein n=1 Tax=Plutella xylostella TaxID=51655 RepID=A0ABQ7QZQ8_PLUXY|nr:hypothetical protein JYU34_003316 [Plutella xylostella]